jgi:superfamily II DNA helicase RecQ
MPWHPRDPVNLPSYSQIQSDVANAFNVIPCISQIKAMVFQMQKKTDFVFISGTGSGKTLTFWIPMLYEMGSITILVTALNVLERQTATNLSQAGITAINIMGENATDETFKVCRYVWILYLY